MLKLRIGYFADGPWSYKAFDLIKKDPSIDVKFIVPRYDTKDEVLKNLASENGIDYLTHVKVNSREFYATAEKYNCDLFVSMSFNQIFKKDIIGLPAMGVINCHAGKLPFYRGRNILNWAIINDEKEFGITTHFVDEGIDTGDIIAQRTYTISDEDNYNTLLLKAYDGCAAILYDSLKLLMSGKYERLPQTTLHPVGSYFGIRGDGDEIINWNNSSRFIFNFVRAICKPGPMATTYCRGEVVRINKATMIPQAPSYICTPGQILSKTPRGFLVKTIDSFIEISEIHTNAKLRVGDKLSAT